MTTTVERTTSSTSTKLTTRSSSCSSTSSTRKQKRSQFAKYYSDLCHIQHSHPLSAIKQNLDKGILDFYCDRIKFDEWWTIINALGCDKSLHLIAIRARHPQRQAVETADTESKARAVSKQPVVATRFVLLWLIEAVKMCLRQSSTLTVLELEGLPLAGDYLTSLCGGLEETGSLQHLSLSKCFVRDEGCDAICHAVKNLPCVVSLDLSQCGLSERGAEIIAELIKYQKLNRYSEAWKQTLRYRDPDVEAMPGLRRITLNGNQEIGDKGIFILTEEIKDDLWLRAFDVQDCGLTDEGGRSLLDLLESNSNLLIVDGRGNPFMNEKILLEIMNQLAVNNQNKNTSEYKWINKNLGSNKTKFQPGTGRPRPWSCQSSTRVTTKTPPPSECCSTVIFTKPFQFKGSNTSPSQETLWKKSQKDTANESSSFGKCSENERLRLQLRDLTLILSQEVKHKLALMEENKHLKELLEMEEQERKKAEAVKAEKVLTAEEVMKALEEALEGVGLDAKEETKEPTAEREISCLISNLSKVLSETKKDSRYCDNEGNQMHSKNLKDSADIERSPARNERKIFIDIRGEEEEEEKQRSEISGRKRARPAKNKPKNQTIWEEDETSSNCGEPEQIQASNGGKSKAQAMFVKILEGGGPERTYAADPGTPKSSDSGSSSTEIPEKPSSYSCEDNSS